MKWCISSKLRTPFFSIRDAYASEIYISQLLPSPRTALSLLARGLGEINGLCPEMKLDGVRIADLLMWSVEKSSYAFVKPLSPLTKSSQMWRVKSIEKSWIVELERISDAVETELVSSSSIGIYYLVDIDKLNGALEGHVKILVNKDDIIKALSLCQRLGNTESLTSLDQDPRLVELKSTRREGEIDTYIPLDWIEQDLFVSGILEDLYVNVLLGNKGVEPTEFHKTRHDKKRFLLPLRRITKGQVARLVWYEPGRPKVRTREGYFIGETEDGSLIPFPEDWL
jgi:CRISPR-associated protein Cas5 subtype I-A